MRCAFVEKVNTLKWESYQEALSEAYQQGERPKVQVTTEAGPSDRGAMLLLPWERASAPEPWKEHRVCVSLSATSGLPSTFSAQQIPPPCTTDILRKPASEFTLPNGDCPLKSPHHGDLQENGYAGLTFSGIWEINWVTSIRFQSSPLVSGKGGRRGPSNTCTCFFVLRQRCTA